MDHTNRLKCRINPFANLILIFTLLFLNNLQSQTVPAKNDSIHAKADSAYSELDSLTKSAEENIAPQAKPLPEYETEWISIKGMPPSGQKTTIVNAVLETWKKKITIDEKFTDLITLDQVSRLNSKWQGIREKKMSSG